MGNGVTGPGVQKFREAYAAGAEPDVAAIVREHPDEALALANAVIKAAAHKSSEGRTRMWMARAEVLGRAGEDVTLGAVLRRFREHSGLSRDVLSAEMAERGTALSPTALEQIEANHAPIANIRTPGLWPALAGVLHIAPHQIVAAIEGALSAPRGPRSTRMERGATPTDRERFLGEAKRADMRGGQGPGEDAARYLEWVKAELGLPQPP